MDTDNHAGRSPLAQSVRFPLCPGSAARGRGSAFQLRPWSGLPPLVACSPVCRGLPASLARPPPRRGCLLNSRRFNKHGEGGFTGRKNERREGADLEGGVCRIGQLLSISAGYSLPETAKMGRTRGRSAAREVREIRTREKSKGIGGGGEWLTNQSRSGGGRAFILQDIAELIDNPPRNFEPLTPPDCAGIFRLFYTLSSPPKLRLQPSKFCAELDGDLISADFMAFSEIEREKRGK